MVEDKILRNIIPATWLFGVLSAVGNLLYFLNGKDLNATSLIIASCIFVIELAGIYAVCTLLEAVAEILTLLRNKKEEEKIITWKCPECNSVNPNSTYVCQSCKVSLV